MNLKQLIQNVVVAPDKPDDATPGMMYLDDAGVMWVKDEKNGWMQITPAGSGLATRCNEWLKEIDVVLGQYRNEDTESVLRKLLHAIAKRLYDRQEWDNDVSNR